MPTSSTASLRKAARRAGILILLPAALALWGLFEPRAILDETHESVAIPGLPAQWEGRVIAVLADLQVGMWFSNVETVRRAIARTVQERPAAVLLAGDFVYEPGDEEAREEALEELEAEDLREVQDQIAQSVALLRPLLDAGIPVYAVLGNHDYLQEEREAVAYGKVADQLAQTLRQAGVTVLRNEAVVMRLPGPPLYLGGIDSAYAGRARPDAVVAAIPQDAPRIILMHNPDPFEELPPGSAPLAIAGHTHGGQVRVPGLPHWSWMTLVQGGRVTADGWILDYGAPGNRLYVNRGIGFSRIPIRINCPPELTWITLRRGGQAPAGELRR
ncbi:MAG TPA: metallophosphoesterase [Noviherbaspirillum sp.]